MPLARVPRKEVVINGKRWFEMTAFEGEAILCLGDKGPHDVAVMVADGIAYIDLPLDVELWQSAMKTLTNQSREG